MLQPKVTAVKPLPDYKLLLDFETGERKIFDVTPYIRGDWYGKLRDVDVFRTVHVAGISIAWADGQDIAPHELYDDSVPTWEPDFTKLTPAERADLEESERDLREGRTVRMEDIDWD